MARSKFSHSEDEFRLETVKAGHPAFALSANTQRTVTITVPTGAIWEPVFGCSFISTTATVGARAMQISCLDSGGVVNTYFKNTPVSVAASSVTFINYFTGGGDLALTNLTQDVFIPRFVMDAGSKITFQFSTGVDAADTHTLCLIVKEYA